MTREEILKKIENLKQDYKDIQNAVPKYHEEMEAQMEQMEYIEDEINELESML